MPKIEIDNLNTVKIWLDDIDALEPSVLQPTWPDGTKWASKEEAQSWAEALVEANQNPSSEFLPGDTPGQPLRPRLLEVTDGSY